MEEIDVQLQAEAVLNNVKGFAAENIGKSGREINGDSELEDHNNKAIDVAGLGRTNQLVLINTGEVNTTVVCINVIALESDKTGRDNDLFAVSIMETKDAQVLRGLVDQDPRVLFQAVKKANGGKPLTQYDGASANMKVGGVVEILPDIEARDTRSSYREKVGDVTYSAQFPPDYKPW